MNNNPIFSTDGYKVSHHKMYPEGVEKVYSNFTPRSNKHAPLGCNGLPIDKVVSFGQQMAMNVIHEAFEKEFFGRPKSEVMHEIKSEFEHYLGNEYDITHFSKLYDLGYLPIEVKALPEGTLVPIGVPILTIENTHKEFFWITNYLETYLSQLLWKPVTSATIAFEYRKLIQRFVKDTNSKDSFLVDYMAHDFSARGLDPWTVCTSGMGHALVFAGSDSLPVIKFVRNHYHGEGQIITSVPASEHSVMCAGGKEDEVETFRRLMKAYPTGILSIVSDTWDLWHVCTNILPQLKEEILARDGKIVIRPDSGNPADIICGLNSDEYLHEKVRGFNFNTEIYNKTVNHPSYKGVVELLWDLFGGSISDEGYKVLDPHIGVIYGDSITLPIAKDILTRLKDKGFAATNIVLGVGSYTYQFNTRDTFGFAMKATNVTINGKDVAIFKDPITDSGTKKSAKGLLCVGKNDSGDYHLINEVSRTSSNLGYLNVIYRDGVKHNQVKWSEVKGNLKSKL